MRAEKPASGPFEYVRGWNDLREQKGWWHSFELPDGTRIEGVCPLQGLKNRIANYPIPQNLSGKRVLDIGTWDGWFAFEMERRGAEVMAVDNWENPRFLEMHARLGSRAEYRQLDVFALTPDRVGYFDIVLFMGVLYHLKHPLLALERVCALTKELAAVDSFVLRDEHRPGIKVQTRPVMEFYETDEFGGQTDNWVGPSLACLMAFCRTAGFARVEHRAMMEHNACLACYRTWEPLPDHAASGPDLLEVFHHKNFGFNFYSDSDEYMTAKFRTPFPRPTLTDVKPEVSGYGVRPLHIHAVGDQIWEATFKLPPGLTAGAHDVRLRIGNTAPGNPYQIAVDMPVKTESISILRVCDGKTWKRDEIDVSLGDTVAVWVEGLPANADKNNVRANLDGRRVKVTYVEPWKPGGPGERQVNAQLPDVISPGSSEIEVMCGGATSPGMPVNVFGAAARRD